MSTDGNAGDCGPRMAWPRWAREGSAWQPGAAPAQSALPLGLCALVTLWALGLQ